MELRVKPLKWWKAKRYDVAEIPKRRWVSGGPQVLLGEGDPTPEAPEVYVFEPALNIVACTKEEPYWIAVSAECATCLGLANTVGGPRGAAAAAERSARACGFATQWGLLHSRGTADLNEFLAEAKLIRAALKTLERNGPSQLQIDRGFRANVTLETADNRSLSVTNLLALCWIELIEAAQRGDQIYSCAIRDCNNMGLQPKWGRPRNYCSDACRKAGERERAKKGRSR